MNNIKLGVVESHFAEIIWDNEPLTSKELVALCNEKLEWQKSTTYTVLKKLCDKGIFQNENGVVISLLSKQDLNEIQSEQFVNETFSGSLPAFISAYTKRRKISAGDIKEIYKMLKSMKNE